MAEKRVVVITGASQGVGRQLAVAFAENGDTVVVCDALSLDETVADVRRVGGEIFPVVTDIRDASSVAAMAETVLAQFGKVDVVAANAWIGGPSGRLWEIDPAEWLATFDVNVHGMFLVTRALLPVMIDRRSGSVIVIGSISGKRPLFGRSAYTTSKMALVGLTRTLALETGPYGVRVNLISIGFVPGSRMDWVVATQAAARGLSEEEVRAEFISQAALLRFTDARDVADAAVFLASDAARAITGVDLNVNSGAVMY